MHGICAECLVSLNDSVIWQLMNSFYSLKEYLDRDNKFEPGGPQ
jgi:hypothetical protein